MMDPEGDAKGAARDLEGGHWVSRGLADSKIPADQSYNWPDSILHYSILCYMILFCSTVHIIIIVCYIIAYHIITY